jgi:anti-sigma-K factor RskA
MADERRIGVDDRVLDDAALEALAEAHATPPPAALRDRVLADVRREAAAEPAQARARRWRLVGAAAAMLAVAAGGLVLGERSRLAVRTAQVRDLARANTALEARVEEQSRALVTLREGLTAQAQVLRVVASPTALRAALAAQPSHRGAGQVIVEPNSGDAVVVLTGLPPTSNDEVYELWAIRGEAAPEPAGLIPVGADGTAARPVDRVPEPATVTAFAVSLEPAGGSPSPTGPIVLVGTVGS